MGLKEATNNFSRAMSMAMAGLQGTEVAIYLDDLIIFARNLEEHGKRFRRVMKRLIDANLTVEPKKCEFLKREASVLGHIVGGGEIKTDPIKIEAVKNYLVPTNRKTVKQWLAFINYYRIFIKNFAEIARPISKLQKKITKFIWGDEQQKAFDKLKEILCSEPVLIAPDWSKPFKVTTDASDYALGAILSQGRISRDRACAYASRCLKGSELRYSTYDKELLAVVFAVEKFRHFLYGNKFTVVTDHESLKHFQSTKILDLRFNRLKAALRGYDFDVVYRPGRINKNADARSRNPVLAAGEKNPERPRAE